ncbi:unnamed protein product [Thelazia callipaeda]|uniref:non-specific protein-tyrosine kinase n=1 Tax=Thelazia callipaeda TaxID=103827 RepID=A0A0N5CJH3_THECL|nr:unnamed protein product [Thelazia callipaeda]
MEEGVYIEEALQDVLKETDLMNFKRKLCVELQLLRLEHFDHITDHELKYHALSGLFFVKYFKIKLFERLGEGSFAVVNRAIWTPQTGNKLDVAVKILRHSTTEIIEDLQREVRNMQKLQHPNLIQLYGIVFTNPAMMVLEFCDGGALIDRLRSTEKPVILVSILVEYAKQIAKGMAYLESKRCVHRDLAARNVLLTNADQVAKICDFGLMRVLENNERLYVMSTEKKVPFAWCPPESLRYRQFSHASDVWSFGVTLWELFSYGEEPWIGLRGAEVLSKLEAGERLPKPQRCSPELYDLISRCWSLNVNSRPTFSLLKGILSEIIFMIAEVRERITIVNSYLNYWFLCLFYYSDSVWYGQNMRTAKFGFFHRSSVHIRSERYLEKICKQMESPLLPESKAEIQISRPVPGVILAFVFLAFLPCNYIFCDLSNFGNKFIGSFIHAGHGDINSEESWGQPDYIDDIYLKNPILRSDKYIESSQHSVPEIIPSLTDLKPPLYRWQQNEGSTVNGNVILIVKFSFFRP